MVSTKYKKNLPKLVINEAIGPKLYEHVNNIKNLHPHQFSQKKAFSQDHHKIQALVDNFSSCL